MEADGDDADDEEEAAGERKGAIFINGARRRQSRLPDGDDADVEAAAGERNDAIIISGNRRRQSRPMETTPTWRQQASAMTRSSSVAPAGGDS